MNCTEAREALLVADLAELRGKAETPLGAHIGACPNCRRAASVIALGTAGLGSSIVRRRSRGSRRSRRVVTLLVPLAAAMVLAVVLNGRRASVSEQPLRVAHDPLPVARTVSLEVKRGQRVTMLKTADPKVTVIWLSSGEGK
jgi:hypothetical protein